MTAKRVAESAAEHHRMVGALETGDLALLTDTMRRHLSRRDPMQTLEVTAQA